MVYSKPNPLQFKKTSVGGYVIYVNILMVESVYSSLQVVNNQAPLDLIL